MAKKASAKVSRSTKPKKYKLEMFFNGQRFDTETDNIREAILSFKPDSLYTEVFISIIRGEHIMDRKLNLRQGKNLFINNDFMEVFISNLLF